MSFDFMQILPSILATSAMRIQCKTMAEMSFMHFSSRIYEIEKNMCTHRLKASVSEQQNNEKYSRLAFLVF